VGFFAAPDVSFSDKSGPAAQLLNESDRQLVRSFEQIAQHCTRPF
jgi:hypothetical protein